MPDFLSSRLLFAMLFFASVAMMGFGFYLQYAEGLEPCPLCMTQRIFIVSVGLVGLFAALHHPAGWGTRLYALLGLALTSAGGFFSARHIHIQNLPPEEVPACGPSLEYIIDTFPLAEALDVLLRGNGNCAEVTWTLLGLSIPEWTLIAFVGFGAALMLNLAKPMRPEA